MTADLPHSLPTVEILGVKVSALTAAQIHQVIDQKIARRERSLMLSINVHALNIACEQGWFRDYLNAAALVMCDGAGVQLAARLLGSSITERITYADWVWQLAAHLAQQGYSIYLLGAVEGVVEQAAATLQARYPQLRIVGMHHGYFDLTPGSAENEQVIEAIFQANADILLVGMGMPTQEQWLTENWPRLNCIIGLAGGAVFDYASGRLRRSPDLLNRWGFEWLGRLIIEPKRLWRRYLVGNPLFILRLLSQVLRQKLKR